MYILLGVTGGIVTVIGTVAININNGLNTLLDIADKGYKFDKNAMEELRSITGKEKHGIKKVLSTVLVFVPVVNLITASIQNAISRKAILNNPQIQNLLIPMTDEEKEIYSQMESKKEKLMFATITNSKDSDSKFYGKIGDKIVVMDDEIQMPVEEYNELEEAGMPVILGPVLKKKLEMRRNQK